MLDLYWLQTRCEYFEVGEHNAGRPLGFPDLENIDKAKVHNLAEERSYNTVTLNELVIVMSYLYMT